MRVRKPLLSAGAGILALASTVGLTTETPAVAGSATSWTTISQHDLGNTITTPSIARFGHQYEVVWVADTGGKKSIKGRILDAAGKPTGSEITLISNWAGLGLDPTVLPYNSGRLLAFGGSQTGQSGPYDTGAEYYATSTNGTSWGLQMGSLSANDMADTGMTAVVNDSGTLITALARNDGVQYHIGVSSQDPAPGPDPMTATTGNYSYFPGVGVDRATHKVWTLWYSNSGINGQDGVNAQAIYPTVGARVHAPGSSNPTLHSAGVEQDLSAAARVGGGLYTAYRSPDAQSIVVWRVGAAHPTATIHAGPNGVSNIILSAAPQGRLWLYWSTRNDWRASRSNKAATRFGPVTVAQLPSTKDILDIEIAGDGSAGPLEAVAMITTPQNAVELIARQFLPRLSLVLPKSVKRGHHLVVQVVDVGDPVAKATVHFLGKSAKTNRSGKVSFAVGKHASLGKATVTATKNGYVLAHGTVTVTK